MNVIRLPRVWATPIARLHYGTATRSITTSSLLAPETAPNVFRWTDKSASRLQASFRRTVATQAAPEAVASEVVAEVTSEASAEVQESHTPPSPPPRNPKAAHLPYQIGKSATGNLPVYQIKAAGRIKSTEIKKIKGDLKALATDLKKALKLKDHEIRSNELTSRIEIAGKRGIDVKNFLRNQGLGEDFKTLTPSQT
ncbi:hypothetical protein TWF106_005009 [Orbilia oligospora]|uniref:Large ribosomal subunit protein mL49 n=1 Tax=Orbilia oligospora TaxID=2813651 RepID=A0A6G1MJJ5_ORBOL|nr:hypothetical protein TWF788_005730 [Orbilia oligospora]KAF3196328.1 hypothetical protein TWF106_005009 [Orbilia oligospora]KAF3197309.1 hypothetical protein TWF679_003271 [Orbilia oligospora]KAF3226015.1 hypothetical protein TWF191_005040 [Orbilia oligospora]KAF3259734.1 hypothetical protein TWF192_010589 [Orbilia oligospora]